MSACRKYEKIKKFSTHSVVSLSEMWRADEAPDARRSSPLNKSQQSPKIADGCQSKRLQLPAPVSRHSFFPGLLWAGGSALVFLDKQIRFLLKQAAAVPSDNNVIIQNKWFSSLMRALLWVTKTRPHTDICLILSSWTLSSAGKFTGSDRSAVLKSDWQTGRRQRRHWAGSEPSQPGTGSALRPEHTLNHVVSHVLKPKSFQKCGSSPAEGWIRLTLWVLSCEESLICP